MFRHRVKQPRKPNGSALAPAKIGASVFGRYLSALFPSRKAPLPDLGRLLPRSRQRGLKGVGATPKPTSFKAN